MSSAAAVVAQVWWATERDDIAASDLFARAGWEDWSREPTCQTRNSVKARRKDQVWISSEMQARLQEVRVDWASGLKTHALQQGVFKSGEPDKFTAWLVGDTGPEDTEKGFSDQEFEEAFAGRRAEWEHVRAEMDVDAM